MYVRVYSLPSAVFQCESTKLSNCWFQRDARSLCPVPMPGPYARSMSRIFALTFSMVFVPPTSSRCGGPAGQRLGEDLHGAAVEADAEG